jgi:hypothetical protein
MTDLVPPVGSTDITPAAGSNVAGAVVDGIDLDAVAAAARACPAVDDLCSGPWGGVVSYLPGRQVAGVRVASDHVVISVRGRWGVPVAELARQVRAALAALFAPRRVDIVVADLSEPEGRGAAWTEERGTSDEGRRRLKAPRRRAGDAASEPEGRGAAWTGVPHDEVSSWTTSSPGDVPGVSSSAPITPTGVAIPRPSPPA